MSTTLSRTNARLQGFLLGLNGAYLGCVLLGGLLPSWPFNGLFTPAAAIALLLQDLQYALLTSVQVPYYLVWARIGALALLSLWLFYFFAED
ncbi:hypothetical protein SAMN05216370_3586 [Pseudomonas peli]|jgi:hypothetical protein|uniref:Uncharacterized protein n=1 Tax=Pseudomonas peli TaxID=592361 RepID=A0AB37ZE11_9PSED|nr:hypothetical protein [Pseudomonas peli]NMZ67352.1 hypothetical protein [Pseudomonas peli]SCW79107.1 hypothetical protein SAMN05216370_3586 [Pseudomonas peli]